MSSSSDEKRTEYYTKDLILRAQNNDKEAMDILVKRNTPLVNSLIKKYLYFKENIEDLFQIGTIGLIKAIRNFDFSYETQFSTYAVHIINGEIKRYFRDDGIVKVSRNLKNIYLKAKIEREKIINSTGSEPTINEIAEKISESYENVTLAFEACRMPEYLYDYASSSEQGDSSKKVEDYIEDTKNSIEDKIDIIALKNALSSLDADQRKLIMLRYFKNMTQTDVANIMGVSQVQISRLEKKIIENMKKYMY